MNNSEIDTLLNKIKIGCDELIYQDSTDILAIYVFGSYIRNDFVRGQSDLDIAIVLDIPPSVDQWSHAEFIRVSNLIKELYSPYSSIFRPQSPDIISFTFSEIELAKSGSLVNIIGPQKLLTFLAFDFLQNSSILWGQDILQKFQHIPNPAIFAEQRLSWIRKFYTTQTAQDLSIYNLLASLGTVIQYFAVKNGLRNMSKFHLSDWSLKYDQWPADSEEILVPYFNYIQGKIDQTFLISSDWKEKTQSFLEFVLKI